MANFFGGQYYIDLDKLTDKCRIAPKTKSTRKSTKTEESNEEDYTINVFKYELLKMCIERILSEFSEEEGKLVGLSNEGDSISFKIAFNTLIKNEILIEIEDE